MEKTKILIDIDSLFDTRQARLLQLLDGETVANFVSSDEYNFRRNDDFSSLVDMNKYNNLPKDINLIKKSTLTFNFKALKSKIYNLDIRNSYMQRPYAFEVLLNFQDYNIDEKNINLICNALYTKLNTNTLIVPVRMSEKDLSPAYLKNSDFAYLFIYNSREWLNEHVISLENIKLENSVFYFPSLYYNDAKKIEEEEKKLIKAGFNDSFSFLEFILSEKIKINFLPTIFYSNIIISEIYLSKVNKELVKTPLRKEEENGDSGTKI